MVDLSLADLFRIEALERVWQKLLREDMADGVVSYGTQRFAEDAGDLLRELSREVGSGEWQPGCLTELVLPGKKERTLHIPPLRDRMVARRMLELVGPRVDPLLGASSYGYRTGLGVADAVQAVARWREAGHTWAVRTDVADCFPSVPQHLVLERLRVAAEMPVLDAMFERLGGRRFRTSSSGTRPVQGLPQGCPLSPVAANLWLVDLDEKMQREGFPIVRYADDMVLLAESRDEAEDALRVASREVEGMGMTLSSEKTQVRSFDEGFTFLGEDFGSKYPPVLDEHRVKEPERKVLYAGAQGGRVRISAGRVRVESKRDEVLIDVPSGQVSRLVLFGSVGLTAGARTWALGSDVDVVLASRSGRYLGSIHSASHAWRPARLAAQLAQHGSATGLVIAREIVRAKLAHQRTLLLRFNRRDTREEVVAAVDKLASYRGMVSDAVKNDELMGLEGAGAAAYFPALGALFPEGLCFHVRSKRPPADTANAALSYLYTLLLGECVTALHAAGLDPGLGLLHAHQSNRPSLALDLMEEFRPLIVDQVVIDAARAGRFTPQHSRSENGGITLTKAGKTALLTAYESRLNRHVSGALADYAGSYRRHIYRQAQRLMVAIMGPDTQWTGLSWR